MQVLVSGGLGEAENGEPRINLVPQSGGNRVPRTGLLQRCRHVVGVEQHHPGAAGREYHRAADDHSGSGTSAARPAVRCSATGSGSSATCASTATIRRSKASSATASRATQSHWDYERRSVIQARTANSRDIFSGRLTAQITDRNRVTVISRIPASLLGVDVQGRQRLSFTRSGMDRARHQPRYDALVS